MLANLPHRPGQFGKLSPEVHLPATSLMAILDFVAEQLPAWRDRPGRPQEQSETALTAQLSAHLNSVARHSKGWDVLQFRTEVPDERQKGRRVDLAPTPCGATLCVEGRSYNDFDTLLPIECKRLPTPKDRDRDEREYVIHRAGSTGGVQRFKEGHHGAAHRLGAMIGYVQEGTTKAWADRVAAWITDLAQSGVAGWSADDLLQAERHDDASRMATFRSSHRRKKGLPGIELKHIWISMF
jgi:hypothetical protein